MGIPILWGRVTEPWRNTAQRWHFLLSLCWSRARFRRGSLRGEHRHPEPMAKFSQENSVSFCYSSGPTRKRVVMDTGLAMHGPCMCGVSAVQHLTVVTLLPLELRKHWACFVFILGTRESYFLLSIVVSVCSFNTCLSASSLWGTQWRTIPPGFLPSSSTQSSAGEEQWDRRRRCMEGDTGTTETKANAPTQPWSSQAASPRPRFPARVRTAAVDSVRPQPPFPKQIWETSSLLHLRILTKMTEGFEIQFLGNTREQGENDDKQEKKVQGEKGVMPHWALLGYWTLCEEPFCVHDTVSFTSLSLTLLICPFAR